MDERLRPLKREHLPLLAGLLAEARPGLAAAAAHGAMETGRLAGDRFLVLEEGPDVLGFAWLAPRGAFGAPVLRALVVAPAARRRGVAAALIAGTCEEALRTGADLFLLVPGDDAAAAEFAMHHRFEPVGPLPAFPTGDRSSLLLRRRLETP